MAIPFEEPATASGVSARRLLAAFVRDGQASPGLLLLLSGLPVLVAAWAVLSPPVMLSKTMTQDLLFNLAGAWHVYNGQVPHVDFHDASGRLSFLLTALGFHLLGPVPFAFLVNVAIMSAALFAAAFFAAMRRLPLLPAAIFVILVSLLAVAPANVGDRPEQYTFAMSYNRYCWSAFSILALILFVPPRLQQAQGQPDRAWIDIGVAGGLLAVMFYLKITYFAAGLGAVGFAVLFHPHIRRHWRAWLAVSALLVLNALAPHNHAYLNDILAWSASGAVRRGLMLHFNNFVAEIGQYSPYLAAVAMALWLWWSGRETYRLPLTVLFVLFMSMLLLTQNSQLAGMPSAMVVLFVLYDRLRAGFAGLSDRDLVPLLVILLLFPLLAISGSITSVAGYHMAARGDRNLYVVEKTNLRGLAVPQGERGAFLAFSDNFDYPGRPLDAPAQPLYLLSNYEYVVVLVDAAELLKDREAGGIALLDNVNALPFMLGIEPARGSNLWSAWSAPTRPAEEYLGDVRYVLVPKFSTTPQWTQDMLRTYGSYLGEHFRWIAENRCWILLARSKPPVLTHESTRKRGG